LFKYLLTWWNGSTPGASFTIFKRARFVGQDDYGNRYYEAKKIIDGDASRRRRWVKYRGYAEASKIPAEWHGWIHHTFADPPTTHPLLRQSWETDHLPNMTGTRYALKPPGSLTRGGNRPSATGDYQSWKP
jgi:NADH:ubiquinone oxidoreductase subunit